MGETQKIGSLGEELVVKFLMKRGFQILDRNYRRPWGELDVVAEKKGKIHFVEVKSLSTQLGNSLPRSEPSKRGSTVRVSSETSGRSSGREKTLQYIRFAKPKDWYRPEDSVSRNKMLRLSRIIQTYLMRKHVSDETTWQFDVATVLVDEEKRKARVNLIENIIVERR